MKILCITQARLASSRLPGKVLKSVGNKNLLEIQIERLALSKKITDFLVATSINSSDDPIEQFCKLKKIKYFRGSEENVLSRFFHAAETVQPNYVVRVTADCPLIDPTIVDLVIDQCIKQKVDYASNTLNPTYPDGIDVEVFRYETLMNAFKNATLMSDKEHVTPYIWRNSTVKGKDLFNSYSIENSIDYSSYRLTVDEPADFEVIESLIKNLGSEKGWLDYILYLENNSSLKKLNSHYLRNEGFELSLKNDNRKDDLK
ncbi:MAG: glycosyltransferase family protein [Bacteriovoracaceae bacterium]